MAQTNFTAGELHPDFWDNADLAQVSAGAGLLQNFLPTASRPIKKRPGFFWRGAALDSASVIIPYRRSKQDSYLIELSHEKARIWGADGVLIKSPSNSANALEIVTNLTSADLPKLRYKQIGNFILFFTADGKRPYRLRKTSEQVWDFNTFHFEDGPWQDENIDQTKTMTVSDYKAGTVVTVTTNFDFFEQAMAGTQIRLRNSTGLPGLPTWYSNWDPLDDHQLAISNGRIYRCTNAGGQVRTGNTPPIHDAGIKTDGGPLLWEFLHDNSGVMYVTSDSLSARSARCYIMKNLPTEGKSNNTAPPTELIALTTFSWSVSAYSDYYGWPTAWPELNAERIIVGGGKTDPERYYASQVAGYNHYQAFFSPGLGNGLVLDDDAITGYVGDDGANALWFCSGSLLVMGTSEGEAVLVGETGEQPLTPATAKPRALSRYGSSENVRPLKIQDAIVWVTRSGNMLRDLVVSAFDYPGQGQELSFFANHLTSRGLALMDYQADPYYTIWFKTNDKGLISFTYHREMGVKAWARHALGGGYQVESLGVLPDANGLDRLWLLVSRTIDNVTTRHIWQQARESDQIYLDGAVMQSAPFGEKITQVTNIAHENTQLLDIVSQTDNKGFVYEGTAIVGSGNVTKPNATGADQIVAGHDFVARYESLNLNRINSQNKKIRPRAVKVRFYGLTISVGQVDVEKESIYYTRTYDQLYGLKPKWDKADMVFEGQSEEQPRFFIQEKSPFELTIAGYDVEAQ